MAYQTHEVPDAILGKWQATTDVMADIFDVPAGLIMRVHPEEIEVLVSAHRSGNPYEHEEKARLNTGLYCETVMATRQQLLVPNALEDPHWKDNPDVALNMISYLGVPLLWSEEEVFGTICVLDSKTRRFQTKYIDLLWEIKRSIESDFRIIQHQQRLARSNIELADAVGHVTRYAGQLEQTNKQLAEAMSELKKTQARLLQSEKNAALGSLVVGVAHELNTPIGNGLMAASTLRDAANRVAADLDKGLTRAHARDFVHVAQDSSELLMRSLNKAASLVNNFKQIAVDRSSLSLSRFAVAEAFEEVLASMALAIRSSGHQVRFEAPPAIAMLACSGALGHVLGNLLDNALKHAFEPTQQGRIELLADSLPDDMVSLRVRDNGRGIPPDLQARIFDPFVTTRLGQGGSGLGLHTAYNLVHNALGGSIEVQSTPGEGTCFTITLPRVALGGKTVPPSSTRH